MNCFSAATIDHRRCRRRFRDAPRLLAAAMLLALVAPVVNAADGGGERYGAVFTITLHPDTSTATVELRVAQSEALLRELRMPVGERLSGLEGDGDLDIRDGTATWQPPARGGRLTWTIAISHRRNGDGFDAQLTPDWGIFRAEDVIPRAATTTLRGAVSATELRFRLPARWSVVTEYPEGENGFRIDRPERRFDQPTGWIAAGRLGVRRERIAGIRVAVAGPVGHAIRRMDTLALLNWTLPELDALLPGLPDRLTIVSAGDPMWRGGLSAPASLFIHADRPLISENATSTLLHELLHLALGIDSTRGYDWIVEGLAEYYSLELLRRSGTITRPRYEYAKRDLADWAESADELCGRASSGATTALAVTVFARLDAELRRSTAGSGTLDDVVRILRNSGGDVDLEALNAAATQVMGRKPDALHRDRLPGCRNIAARD